MSMYGTPTSGRPFARPTLDAVDLTQGRERLLAPGVVPLPGLSKQAAELEQVMGIIGGIGSVASGASSLIRTDTAQRRAAQAEADQVAAEEDRRAREYNIGLAEQDATNISTDVGAQIQTGKVTVDPANFGTFVDQIVATRGTLQNKDYQDALRRRVGTMVAREVQQARVVQEQRTQADIFDKLTSRAYTDPSSAPDVVRTLNESFSNLPEGVRFKPVFDAAKRLAEQGSDQYKTVADQLPESYAIDKGILENQYNVAQSRFTAQRAQNAENVIGQYRYGGNYQGALATLQGFVDTGVLDGEKANTIKKGIEEEQRAALAHSFDAADDAAIKSENDAYMNDVRSLIKGGQIYRVQNFKKEITLPSGKPKTIEVSDTKAREEGINKVMFDNAGVANPGPFDIPPATPQNVKLASDNGYVPEGWMRVVGHGYSTLSLNTINDPKSGVPNTALAGYATYNEINSRTQNLVQKLDAMQPEATKFYRMVDTLLGLPEYQGPTGPNIKAAMTDAYRRMQTHGLPDDITQKNLTNAVSTLMDGAWWNNADNRGDASVALRRTADGYITAGMEPKAAIEKASEVLQSNSIIINRRWIGNVDASIQGRDREQLPTMAQDYLKGFETPTQKASALSFKPVSPYNDTDGIYVVDKNGLPVDPYTRTTWREIIDTHRKKQARSVIQDQNSTQSKSELELPGSTSTPQEMYAKSFTSGGR